MARNFPLCKDCKKMTHDVYSIRCAPCRYKFAIGKNNPHWKGGINTRYRSDRTSESYIQWRKGVFEKDNYTCQRCGDKRGGNLVAHHLLTFKKYERLRFNINIGTTLCEKCHIEIHKKNDPMWVLNSWFQIPPEVFDYEGGYYVT